MPLDLNARLQIAKSDPDAIAYIFGNNIPPEDSYLYQRLGGNFAKYEEMLLDPQVRGKLYERVGALLGRSVLVEEATSSKQDVEAAAIARRVIDGNLIPYEQICSSFLLSGLVMGFAVQAIVATEEKTYYDPVLNEAGEVTRYQKKSVLVPRMEFVPQRRFAFRFHEPKRKDVFICTDEDLDLEKDIALVNGYELRLLTRRAPVEGERCPKNRFFAFTFGSLKGLPQGYGLGAMIRKFYEIRKECLKSGVLTGDRLGSPPVHGTYPETLDRRDPDEAAVIGAFERLLRAVSPNASATTTEGFKINFLEPRSGGHTLLKWLYDTAGVEITRAIWGEGSYSEKSTGSYAAETQQAENRNENVVDSDCNSLDEQLGDQFWRWFGEHNYPKSNFPSVRRETYAERRKHAEQKAKEEWRNQRVQTDRTLILDLGLSVTPEYIKETYGEAFSMPDEVTPLESFEDEPEGEPESFSESVEFGANVHRYLDWNGLRIGIRNLPGETRFPQFRTSKKLSSAYGFVEGHKVNGRSLRCYVYSGLLKKEPEGGDTRSAKASQRLYQITQLSPATGEVDEVKLMIGYPTRAAAAAAYRREMPEVFYGGIRPITDLAQFTEEPDEEDELLDRYEARLTRNLTTAYGENLDTIQQFIDSIANSEATEEEKYRRFVDGIFDLYEQLDPQAIAQALGGGLAAGYLAGMYSERVDRDVES